MEELAWARGQVVSQEISPNMKKDPFLKVQRGVSFNIPNIAGPGD
jgi:hypothetical protein